MYPLNFKNFSFLKVGLHTSPCRTASEPERCVYCFSQQFSDAPMPCHMFRGWARQALDIPHNPTIKGTHDNAHTPRLSEGRWQAYIVIVSGGA